MKTAHLNQTQLEFVVASCMGYTLSFSEIYGLEVLHTRSRHAFQATDYTSVWSDASPVIERMRATGTVTIGTEISFEAVVDGVKRQASSSEPTLEALMRVFVEVVCGPELPSDNLALLNRHKQLGKGGTET